MNTLDIISQALVSILGCGTVYLLGCKSHSLRRWGYVCGVASEPFWLYTLIYNQQWMILPLTVVYITGWLRGLKNNWKGNE